MQYVFNRLKGRAVNDFTSCGVLLGEGQDKRKLKLGRSNMELSTKVQDQLKKFDGRIVDLFGDSDGNARVRTMNTKQCNRRHERYAVPVAAWIEFYGDT